MADFEASIFCGAPVENHIQEGMGNCRHKLQQLALDTMKNFDAAEKKCARGLRSRFVRQDGCVALGNDHIVPNKGEVNEKLLIGRRFLRPGSSTQKRTVDQPHGRRAKQPSTVEICGEQRNRQENPGCETKEGPRTSVARDQRYRSRTSRKCMLPQWDSPRHTDPSMKKADDAMDGASITPSDSLSVRWGMGNQDIPLADLPASRRSTTRQRGSRDAVRRKNDGQDDNDDEADHDDDWDRPLAEYLPLCEYRHLLQARGPFTYSLHRSNSHRLHYGRVSRTVELRRAASHGSQQVARSGSISSQASSTRKLEDFPYLLEIAEDPTPRSFNTSSTSSEIWSPTANTPDASTSTLQTEWPAREDTPDDPQARPEVASDIWEQPSIQIARRLRRCMSIESTATLQSANDSSDFETSPPPTPAADSVLEPFEPSEFREFEWMLEFDTSVAES